MAWIDISDHFAFKKKKFESFREKSFACVYMGGKLNSSVERHL